ncbi:hypothetical protein D3C87_1798440 [compost metagenome]
MMPGKNAPAYNCTTDTPAVAPYTMSSTEGGIRMPRQPPAVMTPADSRTSYPARSICGKASSPINVTTAPTMPVAVANTAQVTSVATPSEPGTRASARCRLRNSLSIKLARSTR